MTHDYHEGSPHYSPHQLLVDLCGECAARSANPWLAIEHMDPVTFARAWQRALAFGRGEICDDSDAERPVLRVLYAFALQLERAGWPFGMFPACPPVPISALAGEPA